MRAGFRRSRSWGFDTSACDPHPNPSPAGGRGASSSEISKSLGLIPFSRRDSLLPQSGRRWPERAG
ncbi:hypothetical protein LC55x_0754 [Lysobacter capsici]|nr:hypothetical protein LC55x_0754 [Lysobacter capsici]